MNCTSTAFCITFSFLPFHFVCYFTACYFILLYWSWLFDGKQLYFAFPFPFPFSSFPDVVVFLRVPNSIGSGIPALSNKNVSVPRSIDYDFPRRAVGFLQTPDASRRARTANIQLFLPLRPPSRCAAHAAVGAVEEPVGVRVPAGYLCLFDPFVVRGWDRCAFD